MASQNAFFHHPLCSTANFPILSHSRNMLFSSVLSCHLIVLPLPQGAQPPDACSLSPTDHNSVSELKIQSHCRACTFAPPDTHDLLSAPDLPHPDSAIVPPAFASLSFVLATFAGLINHGGPLCVILIHLGD